MQTRPLIKLEASNLALLNNAGIESALIFLTRTGLQKSILDATQPVRALLETAQIHSYSQQNQGADNKIILPLQIVSNGSFIKSKISLYRPLTKNGDPRLWPSKLNEFATESNVLAIFAIEGRLAILNLSVNHSVYLNTENDLTNLLEHSELQYNLPANELLFKLLELAKKGPLPAVCEGSTAIGRTLEQYLGITINSSPLPDFKGIEIKSGRSKSSTRSNLFARVPDWDISKFKSSREIVEAIGYPAKETPNIRRLYCSVSTQKPNSQGLFFDLDLDRYRLDELLRKNDRNLSVCAWQLEGLHAKLLEKHPETFWVKAQEIMVNNSTHFQLESVKHTRKPSVQQFNRLLGSGDITMDHLIKRTSTKVTEKGPIFKIKQDSIDELFLGRTLHHSLTF